DGLLRRPRIGRPSRATRQLDWGYGDPARLCFEARRVPRPAPVGALRRMPGANGSKPAPDPRLQDTWMSADHREGPFDPRFALVRGDGALRQRAAEPRRHGDRVQGRPEAGKGT